MDIAIHSAINTPGALAAAIVDVETGVCLTRGDCSGSKFSLSLAATTNARILRAQIQLLQELNQSEQIEDLLITLDSHYHLIRLVKGQGVVPDMFLYLVSDRKEVNLALARRKLMEAERLLFHEPDALRWIEEARRTALATVGQPTRRTDKVKTADRYAVSTGNDNENEEELPPFMREDSVMRLLGIKQ